MATLAISLSGSGLATTNGSRNFTISDAHISKLVAQGARRKEFYS